MRIQIPRQSVPLLLTLSLAACGGGGSSSGGGSNTLPTTPQTTTGTLAVTIGGANSTINKHRRPTWIPADMASASIFVLSTNGTGQVIGSDVAPCTPTTTCQLSISEVPATYSVVIAALDKNGFPLSQVTVQATVTSGQTNTIHATLGGVVTNMSLSPQTQLLLNGTPQTTQLIVTGYDQDGEVVMAPGNYSTPIQLTVTATNSSASASSLAISETTVKSPADTITLTYDGKSYNSLTITTNVPDKTTGDARTYIIAPQLTPSYYTIPSGTNTTGAIITGPDGNVWATTQLSIVRATTSGQVSETCANPGPNNLVAGPNGQIWYGTDISFMPSPFGGYSCAASSSGLREISTSGVQSTIPLTNYVAGQNLSGPVLGPDGTAWVQTFAPGSNPTLDDVNASGTVTQTFQPLINGSPFTGYRFPAIASDGSFWYTFEPGVVRCTIASGCSSNIIEPSPFLSPEVVVNGPNNTMILQGPQDLYALDLNQNTVWNTNHPWLYFFSGAATYFNGAVWIGAQTDTSSDVPQILHILPNGKDFAYLHLPAVQVPSGSTTPPSVGGILLGPDGRLWFTLGSSIGAAPIQ